MLAETKKYLPNWCKCLCFFGLLIALAPEVSAVVKAPAVKFETIEEDTVQSLVFEKLRSGREEVLLAGTDVRLWTRTSGSVKGRFLGVVDDEVVVLVDGKKESYPLSQISKLQEFPPKDERIIGILAILSSLVLLGISALVLIYGLIFTLLIFILSGLGSLFELLVVLGVTALVSLPLAFAGGVLHKAGLRLTGKVYNLKKHWKIKKVES